mgnify:CR=1 FL=1
MFTQKRICKISWSQVQDSDVPLVETTRCTRNNIISHIINLTKLLAAMLVNIELYHNIRGAPNLHTALTPTYRCGHAQDVSAMYACMHTCIPVCVCMSVCMSGCMQASMHTCVCLNAFAYAGMPHVCMYVCVHGCICPLLSFPIRPILSFPVRSCAVLYYVHVLFVLLRHVYKCV